MSGLAASEPRGYTARPKVGDPRLTEGWALSEAARRISAAIDGGDPNELRTAIALNGRLWGLIAATVADDASPLPATLRQDLTMLSAFVRARTEELLRTPDWQRATILIEINRNLSSGLFSAAQRPYPASAPQPIRFQRQL